MLPEKTFEGRVGIVTGGGTGIGLGIARELARLGATVILASRSEEHLAPAVEQIRSETGRAGAANSVPSARSGGVIDSLGNKPGRRISPW